MGTITHSFKKDIIDNFQKSMVDGDTYYYVFAAHAYPWTNEVSPPAVANSYQGLFFEPTKGMLFGKKLANSNIRFLASSGESRRWTSNTVYAQYDHTKADIFDTNFYVITDELKVYKCLYNNRGVPSTIKPTLLQTATFETSDGYIWKYLHSITATDMGNFGSDFYFPVVANSTITNAANDGIDVIEVLAGGSGYVTSTNGTILSIDAANPKIIQIDNSAMAEDDYYVNSAIYITTESIGAPGELRSIEQYIANSTGRWIYVNTAIGGLIATQDKYEINPKVVIEGDGSGAKAISKTSNGVVTQVIVVAPGSGYTRANAYITANPTYGKNAQLIAYVPPPGGHGKNVQEELGCDAIGINMVFDDDESATITTKCSYRTVGLLKNPYIKDTTNRFTGNVFSQITEITVDPPVSFTQGELVEANESGAQGHVVFCNATSGYVILDGDKTFGSGSFAGEVIVGKSSNVATAIDVVSANGTIEPSSGQVLYVTNFSPVSRGSGKKETIKLVIQL